MSSFVKGAIAVLVVIVLVMIGYFSSTYRVGPGNAGLVVSWSGGLENRVLTQQGGRATVWPWEHVVEYPISSETVYLSKSGAEGSKTDDSFPTTTNEGKQIPVDARYTYHMDLNKLPEIYKRWRGVDHTAIENGWIKTELQKAVRQETSNFSVFELSGVKTTEISTKIYASLSKVLAADGIVLEDFSLGQTHPDDKTQASIQANVDAQLALQKLENEKKQAEITAQTKRVSSQGEADAALIAAEGQAKANQALQQSITPELIQMEFAKHWNGVYPTTLVQGNNGSMLQLPVPSK